MADQPIKVKDPATSNELIEEMQEYLDQPPKHRNFAFLLNEKTVRMVIGLNESYHIRSRRLEEQLRAKAKLEEQINQLEKELAGFKGVLNRNEYLEAENARLTQQSSYSNLRHDFQLQRIEDHRQTINTLIEAIGTRV